MRWFIRNVPDHKAGLQVLIFLKKYLQKNAYDYGGRSKNMIQIRLCLDHTMIKDEIC